MTVIRVVRIVPDVSDEKWDSPHFFRFLKQREFSILSLFGMILYGSCSGV